LTFKESLVIHAISAFYKVKEKNSEINPENNEREFKLLYLLNYILVFEIN